MNEKIQLASHLWCLHYGENGYTKNKLITSKIISELVHTQTREYNSSKQDETMDSDVYMDIITYMYLNFTFLYHLPSFYNLLGKSIISWTQSVSISSTPETGKPQMSLNEMSKVGIDHWTDQCTGAHPCRCYAGILALKKVYSEVLLR